MQLRPSGNALLFVGFASCLLFPSCGVIQKYLGNLGLLTYAVLAPALVWIIHHYASAKFRSLISERQALYLAAVTVIGLILIFAFLYPKANTHVNGQGADADEALDLAADELLRGRYPFYPENDPAGFSPFHNQTNKLAAYQSVLPFSEFIVPALGGCIALALAVRSLKRRSETWLRDCAIVQAFLVGSVVTLYIIQRGTFSLILIGYGVFFLFFGVYACWTRWSGVAKLSAENSMLSSIQ